MRGYLKALPNQPVSVRRRFVFVATTVSFLAIVLVWVGVLSLSRERPPASPLPAAALPSPAAPPVAEADRTPAPEPLVDLQELSTNLLRALGPPPPTPSP